MPGLQDKKMLRKFLDKNLSGLCFPHKKTLPYHFQMPLYFTVQPASAKQKCLEELKKNAEM